jgi:hypothetical protein
VGAANAAGASEAGGWKRDVENASLSRNHTVVDALRERHAADLAWRALPACRLPGTRSSTNAGRTTDACLGPLKERETDAGGHHPPCDEQRARVSRVTKLKLPLLPDRFEVRDCVE